LPSTIFLLVGSVPAMHRKVAVRGRIIWDSLNSPGCCQPRSIPNAAHV